MAEEKTGDKSDDVLLVSTEGETFSISRAVAAQSPLVASMILAVVGGDDDDDEKNEIPLPNAKSNILALVISFMNHNAVEPMKVIEKVLNK